MSISAALQVDMTTLQNLLASFDQRVPVCIRGRHAVGKSEAVSQAARKMYSDFYKDPQNVAKYGHKYEDGLPVQMRRLSQLVEGDLTGMPSLNEGNTATVYHPADWFMEACERPMVLFLDERNRALEGVKQAVFEILDSRCFHGHYLHPDTRVYVAENIGDAYTVQQCDPAEVSRMATVELVPSVKEWIQYCNDKCHEMTLYFIGSNPEWLEFTENGKKVLEPNKKYPDRRSWFKLDQQLQKLNMFDSPNNPLFYPMAASMVGIEAALAFSKYCVSFDREVSPEEILSDWDLAAKKIGNNPPPSLFVELVNRLAKYFQTHQLTKDEAIQLGKFTYACPSEVSVSLLAVISNDRKILRVAAPYITKIIAERVNGVSTQKS